MNVREKLPVYRTAASKKHIFVLKPGMRVEILQDQENKRRKILLKKGNKKFSAWVPIRYIKKSKIEFVISSESEKYNRKTYFGVGLSSNQTLMGEQSITDENSLKSSFSAINGSGSFAHLLYDRPYKKKDFIRILFSTYEVRFSGKGNYENGSETDIKLVQNFLSLSALWRSAFADTNFWYLMGAGIDNGTSVELSLNGSSEQLSGDALPFYAKVILGGAYQYPFDSHKSSMLELSVLSSYVANADKTIIPIDVNLSLLFSF